MPAHWTDWNAPVSRALPALHHHRVREDIGEGDANAIAVTKTASVQYVGVPRAPAEPATAATDSSG